MASSERTLRLEAYLDSEEAEAEEVVVRFTIDEEVNRLPTEGGERYPLGLGLLYCPLGEV
jgi:hypothetical protein